MLLLLSFLQRDVQNWTQLSQYGLRRGPESVCHFLYSSLCAPVNAASIPIWKTHHTANWSELTLIQALKPFLLIFAVNPISPVLLSWFYEDFGPTLFTLGQWRADGLVLEWVWPSPVWSWTNNWCLLGWPNNHQVQRAWVKVQLSLSLAMWLWANDFIFLNLSFPICKTQYNSAHPTSVRSEWNTGCKSSTHAHRELESSSTPGSVILNDLG